MMDLVSDSSASALNSSSVAAAAVAVVIAAGDNDRTRTQRTLVSGQYRSFRPNMLTSFDLCILCDILLL